MSLARGVLNGVLIEAAAIGGVVMGLRFEPQDWLFVVGVWCFCLSLVAYAVYRVGVVYVSFHPLRALRLRWKCWRVQSDLDRLPENRDPYMEPAARFTKDGSVNLGEKVQRRQLTPLDDRWRRLELDGLVMSPYDLDGQRKESRS